MCPKIWPAQEIEEISTYWCSSFWNSCPRGLNDMGSASSRGSLTRVNENFICCSFEVSELGIFWYILKSYRCLHLPVDVLIWRNISWYESARNRNFYFLSDSLIFLLYGKQKFFGSYIRIVFWIYQPAKFYLIFFYTDSCWSEKDKKLSFYIFTIQIIYGMWFCISHITSFSYNLRKRFASFLKLRTHVCKCARERTFYRLYSFWKSMCFLEVRYSTSSSHHGSVISISLRVTCYCFESLHISCCRLLICCNNSIYSFLNNISMEISHLISICTYINKYDLSLHSHFFDRREHFFMWTITLWLRNLRKSMLEWVLRNWLRHDNPSRREYKSSWICKSDYTSWISMPMIYSIVFLYLFYEFCSDLSCPDDEDVLKSHNNKRI